MGVDEQNHAFAGASSSSLPRGLVSVLLLLNATCSAAVSSAAFLLLAVQRNESAVSLVVGACFCAVVGKLLKRVIDHSRPPTSSRPGKGMPSSHANCLFFFVASIVVRLSRDRESTLGWTTGSSVTDTAVALVCAMYACTVSLTRALVEVDHTVEQILAGALLGTLCAIINECALRPWPSLFGLW